MILDLDKEVILAIELMHVITTQNNLIGTKMGVVGKFLGGVFSSLSRQKVNGQSLALPFGRGDEGRGLRWKLNTSLIPIKSLAEIVNELLGSWGEGK